MYKCGNGLVKRVLTCPYWLARPSRRCCIPDASIKGCNAWTIGLQSHVPLTRLMKGLVISSVVS